MIKQPKNLGCFMSVVTERQKLVNYIFDLQIYYFHQLVIYPQIYPHFAQVKIFSLSRA